MIVGVACSVGQNTEPHDSGVSGRLSTGKVNHEGLFCGNVRNIPVQFSGS